MLIFCLILAILVGLIRGGKISNIGNLKLKNRIFILLGLGINVLITFLGAAGNNIILLYIRELYILSYVFVIIGIAFNLNCRPMFIIGLGTLGNLVGFLANKGIPISLEGLKMTNQTQIADFIQAGENLLYVPLTEATKLPIFSKMIIIQVEMPFENIYSFGDLVIMIGLFVLVQFVMLHDPMDRFTNMR